MSPDQRRALLRQPACWVAVGFGAGLSPIAPGTAGSLVALLPWLALRWLPPALYGVVLIVAFALGIWVCGVALRVLKIKDPSVVVWDEFVGQWLALAPLLWLPAGWMWILAGFILFRLFDIWKPWPVSWADRDVDGGLGVMLDDAIAGAYAAVVLAIAFVCL